MGAQMLSLTVGVSKSGWDFVDITSALSSD